MPDVETPDALRDDLRAAWHRYIDVLVPLRPALHRVLSPAGWHHLGRRGPGAGHAAPCLRPLGRDQPTRPRRASLPAAHRDERLDRYDSPSRARDRIVARGPGAAPRGRRKSGDGQCRARRERAPPPGPLAAGACRARAEGGLRHAHRRDRQPARHHCGSGEGGAASRERPPARRPGRGGPSASGAVTRAGRSLHRTLQRAGRRRPGGAHARGRLRPRTSATRSMSVVATPPAARRTSCTRSCTGTTSGRRRRGRSRCGSSGRTSRGSPSSSCWPLAGDKRPSRWSSASRKPTAGSRASARTGSVPRPCERWARCSAFRYARESIALPRRLRARTGPSSLPARDLPRSRAMAAIDSLLGIVQMKKASGLLLTSDEVPSLLLDGARVSLTMAPLTAGLLADLLGSVLGPAQREALARDGSVEDTYSSQQHGSYAVRAQSVGRQGHADAHRRRLCRRRTGARRAARRTGTRLRGRAGDRSSIRRSHAAPRTSSFPPTPGRCCAWMAA